MTSSLKQNNLHLDFTVNKYIRQNHIHVFNIQDDVIYACYACNISACMYMGYQRIISGYKHIYICFI